MSAAAILVAGGGPAIAGVAAAYAEHAAHKAAAETVEVPVHVAETKTWRRDINALAEAVKTSDRKSRSRALALQKLEEAVMWLGKDLQEMDKARPGIAPNPYPHGMDPSSPVIEKPAV